MEKIFVDTSALFCLINTDDPASEQAWTLWSAFIEQGNHLFTNNYVLVETLALVQHRLGMEVVHRLNSDLVPLLDIFWIDMDTHSAIVEKFLTANRRQLSLVDCASFETMRRMGIKQAFAFDEHFREQGFTVIP